MVKGVFSGVVGFAFSTVGIAPVDAITRFTFGFTELNGGFDALIADRPVRHLGGDQGCRGRQARGSRDDHAGEHEGDQGLRLLDRRVRQSALERPPFGTDRHWHRRPARHRRRHVEHRRLHRGQEALEVPGEIRYRRHRRRRGLRNGEQRLYRRRDDSAADPR